MACLMVVRIVLIGDGFWLYLSCLKGGWWGCIIEALEFVINVVVYMNMIVLVDV